MPSIVAVMGPFSGGGHRGNQSAWMAPTIVTGLAAMVWLRITGLDSQALHVQYIEQTHYPELFYPAIDQNVIWVRPTMQKTRWLYLVLAIQPLLTIIAAILTVILHSTPLSKGFGLISILSGIDRQSLDHLAGTSLSGELIKAVKLVIKPGQNEQNNMIEYRIIVPSMGKMRNGKLNEKIM